MNPLIPMMAKGIDIMSPYELEAGRQELASGKQKMAANDIAMQAAQKDLKTKDITSESEKIKLAVQRNVYIASNLKSFVGQTYSPDLDFKYRQTRKNIVDTLGHDIPGLPEKYDQNEVNNIYTTGLEATKSLVDPLADRKASLEEQKFGYQQKHDAETMAAHEKELELSRGVAMRGQDISAQNQGWAQTVNPQTGLPVWTQNRTEGMPAYSQTGATNKMTETQGKANIFAQRADVSHKLLSGLEDKINIPGLSAKQAMGSGTMGAIGNTMLSPDQQKVDQAQRDFINAVLRNESGAAISESEFENARKQYFPQIGDSKEVIDQKRKNRELEIKGLSEMAGQSAPVNKDKIQPPQQSQIPPGAITQTSPSTGKRRFSVDGGQTWQMVR